MATPGWRSTSGCTDWRTVVLTEHWQSFGLRLPSGEFNDPDALAAMARITDGNLRLVQRLFSQIDRILEISELTAITKRWSTPHAKPLSLARYSRSWPQGQG